MLDSLFIVQLLISIGAVLCLSLITERAGPKLAGLISGLPIGTAIIFFFIGLQDGAAFASDAVIYNLAGLAAMQFMLFVYYRASMAFGKSLLAPAVLSVIGYLLAVLLLQAFALDRLEAVLVALLSIFLFTYLFREIRDSGIGEQVRVRPAVLLGRAVIAAAIILAVTGTAALVGPKWSGLFSAFPTNVFPLILIIHHAYGVKPVHTIIRNFPTGLAATLAYSLTVSLAYQPYGVYWGTVTAYAAAFLVCVLIYLLQKRKDSSPNLPADSS
ncbi:MAG: hypothetical protein PHV13_01740 [Candidatus ainarchaeum sp.]|nr:hypothetical protein [Candidatus ainarchaeum sp.]